ncbi:phosphopantetheine-binding protein [Kitasatospora sp. NPDC049285]|uniref:phosphopantetheine-binding protein n=1 Tax=Kitasatospora sp. NPDC049285 TaxID=3157096 RepID=UPI0034228DB8
MTEATTAAAQTRPSADFLDVLRRYLPGLAPQQEPAPDTELAAYGLDSMGSISLMLELEETLDVTFPEEQLSADTFRTAGTLWASVCLLRPAG